MITSANPTHLPYSKGLLHLDLGKNVVSYLKGIRKLVVNYNTSVLLLFFIPFVSKIVSSLFLLYSSVYVCRHVSAWGGNSYTLICKWQAKGCILVSLLNHHPTQKY